LVFVEDLKKKCPVDIETEHLPSRVLWKRKANPGNL